MTHRAPSSALALSLVVLATFVVPGTAFALDCGQRLVEAGDGEAYVRSICGEPESMATRTESRTDFVATPSPDGRPIYGSAVTVSIQIDTWVYDFGSTRFMEELTFANGVLRSSRPLSYGSYGGDRRRRDSLGRHGALLPRTRERLALAERRDVLVR
jgi:hypothetical protein